MLERHHEHLNVEIAASFQVAAYLFKYCFKGADSAEVSFIDRNHQLMGAQEWLRVRYLSASPCYPILPTNIELQCMLRILLKVLCFV